MRDISIFLSSPSDVTPERETAERVVRRVNGVYSAHVNITLHRWEHRAYEATRGFQEAIQPSHECDIVLGIFWKRIGTELPPSRFRRRDGTAYQSGSVYEIETAIDASRESGRPAVFVFRKTSRVLFDADHVDEERAQKQIFDEWWNRSFRDEEGRHLAAANSFDETEDFETKWEECLTQWLADSACIPFGPVWDIAVKGSPYPGLLAYDDSRAAVYFGRTLAVEQACEEFVRHSAQVGARAMLIVIGPSGSGKSSLAHAGIVPRLTAPGCVRTVDAWRVVAVAPQAGTIGALADSLYQSDVLSELAESPQRTPAQWLALAIESPDAVASSIVWALDRAGAKESRLTGAGRELRVDLLLVIDQLEELFGTAEQDSFVRLLRALSETRRVWLLCTLRSSHYAQLQRDPVLLELKRKAAVYDLPQPGRAEIADIVKGPARALGLRFEEGRGGSLAAQLVAATPHADALPLLQMTLARLFELRVDNMLTFSAYESIGGVDGAIAAHAGAVCASVPGLQSDDLEHVVGGLVRDVERDLAGDVQFVTRAADRHTLCSTDVRRTLVEQLVEGRLLVTDGEAVRVAHEALLRRWTRAREALDRIADVALRRARLRARVATIAAASLLVLAGLLVASISRMWAAQNEVMQAGREQLSRQLSALSRLGDIERTDRRILLAINAFRASPTLEARSALLSVMSETLPDAIVEVAPGFAATAVATGPNDQLMAAGNADGRLGLWDPKQRRWLLSRDAHDGMVATIAFSPNGDRIASGGADGRVRVWSSKTGELLFEHQGTPVFDHWGAPVVEDVAFDDQSRLRIVDDNGLVTEFATGQGTARKLGRAEGKNTLWGARFDSTGRLLATTELDGILIWTLEASGPRLLHFVSTRHERGFTPLGPLTFNVDSTLLAVTAHDREMMPHLIIVELKGGPAWRAIPTRSQVDAMAFTPFGGLVAASVDGRIEHMNIGSRDRVFNSELMKHTGRLREVSIGKSGTVMAAASDDGSISVWTSGTWSSRRIDRIASEPKASGLILKSAAFTDRGTAIIQSTADFELLEWDPEGNGQLVSIAKNTMNFSLNHDGKILLGSSGLWERAGDRFVAVRGEAERWTSSAGVLRVGSTSDLAVHADTINRVVKVTSRGVTAAVSVPFAPSELMLSPDDKHAVVLSSGGRTGVLVSVLDIASRSWIGQPARLDPGTVSATGFARQGQVMLLSTSSGIVSLDVKSARLLPLRFVDKSLAKAIAVSPDTTMLAAAYTNELRLWEFDSRRPIGTLRALTPQLSEFIAVRFGSDSTSIHAIDANGLFHTWNLDPATWVSPLCDIVGRSLSTNERRDYALSDIFFETACTAPDAADSKR